jgi:ribosome recycling factor
MLKVMEKDKDITEDDHHKGQEKTQELTNQFIEKLDEVLKAKEEEIMEV